MNIRVLVVDDSSLVRRVIATILSEYDDLEVVGSVRNGRIAVDTVPVVEPDVVLMDLEMPVMDGLEATRRLRQTHPSLPVIVFSSHTERGKRATMDALVAGAAAYVHKGRSDNGLRGTVRDSLVPKLREVLKTPLANQVSGSSHEPPKTSIRTGKRAPRVLAIGSSTGGPNALADVIPALPGDLGVPVLIVQHMPPRFTQLLAERLDQRSALTVREAWAGDIVVPNTVYLAPGGFHLRVRRRSGQVLITLDRDEPVHSCRPAVDPMLFSAVDAYGGDVLATILTGMGRDGADGCRAVVEAGGTVLAQDRESSVVWGMPGAVVDADLADEVVPLDGVASAIKRHLRRAVQAKRSA